MNTATETELDQLPGIGRVMVARIIAARPFKSADRIGLQALPEGAPDMAGPTTPSKSSIVGGNSRNAYPRIEFAVKDRRKKELKTAAEPT